MTLEQILVIAAWAWTYYKVGAWLVRELKKQEQRAAAASAAAAAGRRAK